MFCHRPACCLGRLDFAARVGHAGTAAKRGGPVKRAQLLRLSRVFCTGHRGRLLTAFGSAGVVSSIVRSQLPGWGRMLTGIDLMAGANKEEACAECLSS